jgi:hypothetical protein
MKTFKNLKKYFISKINQLSKGWLGFFLFIDLRNAQGNQSISVFSKSSPLLFYNRKTVLCNYLIAQGSDKGGYKGVGRHNYSPLYHKLFKSFRFEKFAFFELGIGSANLSIPSNMGPNGKPGASLFAFREYFPNALLVGADFDRDILFSEERIQSYFCDQTDSNSIISLTEQLPVGMNFRIIIDDGLHTFPASKLFFLNFIHRLSVDGIYIIEDVKREELPLWREFLDTLQPSRPFCIIRIPNHYNPYDNNLVLIKN